MNRTQEGPSEDTEVNSQYNKLQKTYYYLINPVTNDRPIDKGVERLAPSTAHGDTRPIRMSSSCNERPLAGWIEQLSSHKSGVRSYEQER